MEKQIVKLLTALYTFSLAHSLFVSRLQGWAVVCMADRKGRGPIT